MKILLQHKIFIGYFLLMAIIGSMVAIVLHERSRVQKIENESIAIFQTQHNINTTHRYVTTLVTYGESVMVWNDEDSGAYRERRVRTDSMLQTLRTQCKDFIQPEQIDSLRTLLAAKEDHLFQIMEATREQKKTDSLLFHQKPTVTTQTTTRTVTRKKKGIAGFFGGKETVQMPVVTTRQTAPDKELISLLNKRKRDIETYTDSLRLCNRELNRKLRLLITSLDEQTWNAFRSKEERLKASYEHSTLVITGLIIFSIILLFIFLYLFYRINDKMFNENLATLKSPDRQAKCMRIQFEIKEKLPDIISEILHSDKWLTLVRDENHGLRRVTIKDPYFDSEACVDIWEHEIHVTTAWSNYTYRIYQKGNSVWCEYIGAYRGLLEQNLLPTMTPKENILDSEVLNSSLFGDRKETLRNYSAENLKLKNFRRDNFAAEYQLASPQDHPKIVYDEFIKEGVPIPPPEDRKEKSGN